MNVVSENRCAECGAAIPGGSPDGLCGKCLLSLGLQAAQGATHASAPEADSGAQAQAASPADSAVKPSLQAPEASKTVVENASPGEEPGGRIGRYKLLEKIGEGGFGMVYVAEQKEPVKRRVALKVIKLGMDTRQVVARFEAERQALALMDHANIAKIFDGGATASGRPYFVMELVRGVPITQYCDDQHLLPTQRLELFIQVCRAIQHAHQKGVIHRDLKPSNILVTSHDGVPVPKVIDFGIAKATQTDLTDKTVYTQFQHFLGTPAYMSPEQAEMSGLDIDTRSDIYSLGVLLYELLVGATPFHPKDLLARGLDEMRRTIRETEPMRPSTRLRAMSEPELTTTAGRRGADAPKLISLLRGDLDCIVMKCLEKDRTRRYETVNGLAMDLQRHLNHEPVAARPPSAAYRLRKFARRNRVTVAAATAVTALLVVGILASTGEAIRAIRAERTQTRLKEAAQASEQKAKAAEAGQARLRERAEAEELAARQRAYASDMHVAKQALDGSNLGHAQDLLNRQRPQPGQKDLRGWEWRYLWHQTHSDALLTLCEKSAIESLAVSPDGNWLAIGLVRKDGLFVWDLKTRQEVAHLVPGEDEVRAVFSPAEPLLAFTSLAPEKRQASLRLWNTATREMMAQLPLSGNCGGLAFAKDGRTLVTSTAGGLINLWRVADGIKLASYPSEQFVDFTSAGFAVTADLGLAAYGLEAGQIRVVDLRDGRAVWTSAAAKDQVRALAFSPDGKTLASAAGFTESDIRLWDVGTGREIGRLEGHNRWVGALLFWPDGQKLASASADQTIRTWDVASRKCLDVLRGHRLEVWRLALLPDNKTLVSGSKDGAVCLWDTSVTHPRRESTTLPDDIAFWRFTPDSRSVVTLDNEGRVARWSGSGFQEKEAWLEVGRDWLYAGGGYAGANFSADGRFLALGATNGTVTVWDVSRRGIRREFKPGEGNANPLDVLAEGNRVLVWQRASIHVAEWDMEANREIQSWPVPAGWWCFKLSPDERLWVAIGPDGDVTGRNLPEHISANWPIRVLEGYRAAFSADGQLFAVASSEGFARVWRTATWRKEATLRGFLNAVDSVAFSPDGKRLITGGSNPDDAVKLWDVDSWQETLTLEGTGHSFDPTAFSTDGNAIGAKNQDGILRLWQAPSWEEIAAAEARERGEVRQP